MGQVASNNQKDYYSVDEYARSLDLSECHYNSQLKFSVLKGYDRRKVLDMSMKELRRANLKTFTSKGIQVLKLQNNYLKTLPYHMASMTALREIYLQHNHLRYFPVQICSLMKLEVLDVSYNELDSLPYAVGHLTSLNKLDISYNNMKSLPCSFQVLRYLEDLKFHGNGLWEVPQALFTVEKLKNLELCHNNLTYLSKQFLALRHLEKLDVRGNHIKNISSKLKTYLSRLHEVYIGDMKTNNFCHKGRVTMNTDFVDHTFKNNLDEHFHRPLQLPPIPCNNSKCNDPVKKGVIHEKGRNSPSTDSDNDIYVFQSFAFSNSSFSSGGIDSAKRSTSL